MMSALIRIICVSIYLSSHTATPPREDYVQVIARREEKKERMNSENKSAIVRWI